jgi:hypothetical protein
MPEENITIEENSYYTWRQGGAEKSSGNYLLDMLQVVVNIQIKKTAQCTANKSMHQGHVQTHTTHHCLSNHQKHKIIMCSVVGVGQTSLLITCAMVDRC